MIDPDDRARLESLRLVDHRPRQRLRTPETPVERPSMAAIDAHDHLGPTPFSDGWGVASAADLEQALDASSIAAIVDLDGGQGDALRRELERWAPMGQRVAVFAGLDYDMWSERDDFGEEEARRLRDAASAGARGLKVWKLLGLRARDRDGRLVAVDDARLDPVWGAAGELALPVTIHVADPIAFFDPLDASNERYEELLAHPDWHFWPTRPYGRPDLPGFPPFDALIDGLERVVARHPATTFIGAHVGCAAEDLDRVVGMLAGLPNWHVDIAARISELGRRPYGARSLIMTHPDRVLFGTDIAPDARWWATYARFLETLDESFPYEPTEDGGPDPSPGSQGRWRIHGLGLPEEILRLVYAGNARRLLFRDLPGGAGGHVTHVLMAATDWRAWRTTPDASTTWAPAGPAVSGTIRAADDEATVLAQAAIRTGAERGDLVAIDVDLALLGVPWRDDPDAPDSPLIHGPLRRDAVRRVRPVLTAADGRPIGLGASIEA